MSVLQRSPEWFAQRAGKITSSNVGAILGQDPYRDSRDVMRSMVRELHGAPSEFKGNLATEYGTVTEPIAKMALERLMGGPITDLPFKLHDDHTWLGASPDGQWQGNEPMTYLVEIKCPYGLNWKVQKSGEPPVFKTLNEMPHYYSQMQVALYCYGLTRCLFFQYVDEQDGYFDVQIVTLNPDWLQDNIPKLAEFYEAFKVEAETNAEFYLGPKVKELRGQKALALAEEYAQLKVDVEAGSERLKEMLASLVSLAGDEPATVGDYRLVKTERKGSVSYATVVKAHCKDVDLAPYTGKPSTSWSLK